MPGSTKKVAVGAAIAVVLLVGVRESLAPGPPAADESRQLVPARAPPGTIVQTVARRYRISEAAARRTVSAAYAAANEVGVDPLLVLAVIGVESSFDPRAQSSAGATGLMQIIPVWHRERLRAYGGEEALLDPLANIAVGTRILNDYIERAGSLEAGLQRYNGTSSDPATRYARKVFAERERLRRTTRRAQRVRRLHRAGSLPCLKIESPPPIGKAGLVEMPVGVFRPLRPV